MNLGRLFTIYNITITIQLLVIVVFAGCIYQEVQRLKTVQESFISFAERYKLYDREYVSTNRLQGIYYPDKDTMCIWVEGRGAEEVNKTFIHESCHWLIDEGICYDNNLGEISCKEHFCD